jgi:hypothetical protein
MTIIKHDFQKAKQLRPPKKKEKKGIPGFQLRVVLSYSSPPIWRTVQLPGTFTLKDLHTVIQVCFGWDDSASHRFLVGKVFYGPAAAEASSGIRDEADSQLHELEKDMGFIFSYLYDGGSGWECEISLERLFPDSKVIPQPMLLAADRACPPIGIEGIEDIHEYQLLLTSLEAAAPNREEILAGLGIACTFDPSYCDLRAINDTLHRIF